ncbi:surface-adhesin E family protein [Duganella sp. BuS-21]|uniref:surface-adhesin E family protein n=1 Tax=Duganella sp. BuS-21 TaxID=2943848 RepID=UPI0035A60B44
MNKSGLIAITLMLAAGWAQAALWMKVGGSSGSVFYIDKASVIKAEKTRKVWSMQSYARPQKTPEGKLYRSVKMLHLYACEDHTSTLLAQVYYPEAMGKGEPVENYKFEKFNPEDIVPDSPFDSALVAACKI